ncbi:hypothetical protein [Psychrobacillus sp. FSL K6-1415]|uniref:hypothetical protein n=1 Tax=Psychrobacillus sp. FSL K6-1415 TaxID=2921544 RepID=UPI0030F689B5
MTRLKDLTVSIEVKNLDDLKELLQKATDQVEQLQETIKKINQSEYQIKPNLET